MGDGRDKDSHSDFFFILVSANFVKFHELFISRYFVKFLNVDFMRSMLSKVFECSFHDDYEHSFCFKGDFFLFIVSYLVSIVAWHWLFNVNYCLPSPIVPSHHLSLLFVITRYCCLKFFASCHWWLLHAIVKGPCAFVTPFPLLVLFIIGCCCCWYFVVMLDIPPPPFFLCACIGFETNGVHPILNNKQGKFYFFFNFLIKKNSYFFFLFPIVHNNV